MKLKREENLLVVSNKQKDLNEVLDTLVAKDSKKVAQFLVENTSLPRELRIGALRLVLNDYVKLAKELVLSDEFMYRLNWYEKFSEYQLVNFWNVLESSNADKFNAEEEAVRFKKTFYLLLLMNADAVEFSDKELETLLELSTPESTLESFKEFMSESDGAFYDYECNFDGMSYEDFKTVLKKCSTVADIRNIAAKYDINVPKRLKKEELVALVLEGLRRQGKANDETEAQLKKMSAISLQRYAKVNGVKASTEMKKDDIIEFIMNRIESSSKAVRKPRIQLATLPELEEFVFSKDYLREVNIVDDEDEDLEQPVVSPEEEAARVAAEEEAKRLAEEEAARLAAEEEAKRLAEEEAKRLAEEEAARIAAEEEAKRLAEEEAARIAAEEEAKRLAEEAARLAAIEEVEEETEIFVEEEPDNTPYNDELLAAITQLLAEKEEAKKESSDERFNKMIEFYEKRLAHLEELVINLGNREAAAAAPITINLNVPSQETKVIEVTPVVSSAPVVVATEPVVEETVVEEVEEVVEEPAPVVVEGEVAPVVVDPTFDTLSDNQTAQVVSETMGAYALSNGKVVPAVDRAQLRKEIREKRKEEKRAAKERRQQEKALAKELAKNEKNLIKEEKRLAKEEKKLRKQKRHEEAAAVRAERERIKEEKILNQERQKAEREEAKARRKQERIARIAAKAQAKLDEKIQRENEIIAREVEKANKEALKLQKKQEKLEKIRAKNDIATYKKAKSRAFWKVIRTIIFIAILLVLAVFTITSLIDLNIITGDFANFVNDVTSKYVPFLAQGAQVRALVTSWVQAVINFFSSLFGGAQ